MPTQYEAIFKGGRLVDPVNGLDGLFDLAVAGGQVTEVAADLNPDLAVQCVCVEGLTLMPGVIDTHIHASGWLGGPRAHAMMAKAGVCTALDMSGPTASVLDYAARYGRGLNLAVVEYVRPGHTVNSCDPGRDELDAVLDKSLKAGAIGLKILGGHYPLSPEATRKAIETAHLRGAYLAFHAGTTATCSDLTGLREVLQLIEGRPIHLAHINSYCRGMVRPYMEETEEAISLLNVMPHIFSESYLSAFNGTSGLIVSGQPESRVTANCLKTGGYPITADGLRAAILDGWAMVNQETEEEAVLSQGPEAMDYWLAKKTNVTLSFAVNPPEPRIRLAVAKNDHGSFIVKALSTDGGGIPRNVTVEMGLSLIKLKALTLQEFVLKASTAPAWALGQSAVRGHLGPGAWADLTGLDLSGCRAALTVVGGVVIMRDGQLTGTGTTVITTKSGLKTVHGAGLSSQIVNLEDRPFYNRGRLTRAVA
jgi:cytosine/adenosine deaminase-related metal-dependent hydrolase